MDHPESKPLFEACTINSHVSISLFTHDANIHIRQKTRLLRKNAWYYANFLSVCGSLIRESWCISLLLGTMVTRSNEPEASKTTDSSNIGWGWHFHGDKHVNGKQSRTYFSHNFSTILLEIHPLNCRRKNETMPQKELGFIVDTISNSHVGTALPETQERVVSATWKYETNKGRVANLGWNSVKKYTNKNDKTNFGTCHTHA